MNPASIIRVRRLRNDQRGHHVYELVREESALATLMLQLIPTRGDFLLDDAAYSVRQTSDNYVLFQTDRPDEVLSSSRLHGFGGRRFSGTIDGYPFVMRPVWLLGNAVRIFVNNMIVAKFKTTGYCEVEIHVNSAISTSQVVYCLCLFIVGRCDPSTDERIHRGLSL